MELTISKKEFLRSLNRTHSVADRKSSMPILSNILLSTDGKEMLRFAATDLYLSVTSSAQAEVKQEGTIAVSARTLYDIVKNLPEGDVTVKVGDNHAAEIRAGKVRFKIPGMPGQDFPPLPSPGDAEFATLSADELGKLIALTHYSMSSDETRPHLAGALLEGDGKTVRMVTTDGHRLSKAEYKQEDGAMLNFEMLVPNKGVMELKRMIDEARADQGKGSGDKATVEIAHSGANAFFRRQDMLLGVKLADEQFPPYEKVIPKNHERRVVVQRGMLLEALKRISLVANDKSGAVRVAVEPGHVRITSENPDVGEGSEELDVDYAGEGVEIGFNARYLMDVLSSITEDEIALELGGSLDPGAVKPEGPTEFVGVIMPMRI
ncbi:MAG: DNA polymerase III subunit beta [Myxococcales bacterium]|jgi:DNA polymerase-3 subunit beta